MGPLEKYLRSIINYKIYNSEVKVDDVVIIDLGTQWQYNFKVSWHWEKYDRWNDVVNGVSDNSTTIDIYVPKFMSGRSVHEGKNRMQLNSAVHIPVCKFYNSSFRGFQLDNPQLRYGDALTGSGWRIKFSETDESITAQADWEYDYLPYYEVLKYFGLREYIPEHINYEKLADLTDEQKSWFEGMDEYHTGAYEIHPSTATKLSIAAKKDIKPGRITADLLRTCFEIMNDPVKVDIANRDSPADFMYIGAEEALVQVLLDNDLRNAWRTAVKMNLNNYDMLYNTVINSGIKRAFNMQAASFHIISAPKDSNAITLATQANKIVFYKVPAGQFSDNVAQKDRIDYNGTFFGVLDPNVSSDSAEINRNNSLSLTTKIGEDRKLHMYVYNMKFEKVELDYDTYIRSKILALDNVNYDKKEIFPTNGYYSYLQYGEYDRTENKNDIQYIRIPESLLSPCTAVIPFINKQSNTRTLLGSHFVAQSIPTTGAKPPIVHTKYNKEAYNNSPINTNCEYEGIVLGISEDQQHVKIKTDEGEIKVYSVNSYENTSEHTTNKYKPEVKPGDRVSKGTTIFSSNSFVDGEFTTSVPLLAAFGTHFGHEVEDGITLSRSAAEKLGHPQVEEVTLNLVYGQSYEFGTYNIPNNPERYDKFGIIKVGEYVKGFEPLVYYYSILSYDNPLSRIRMSLVNNAQKKTLEKGKCPYGKDGIVKSVNVYFNGEPEDNLKPFYDHYTSLQNEKKNSLEMFTGKPQDDYEFTSNRYGIAIVVEIEYTNKVKLSDKFSNYYGAKGVTCKIAEDDDMPTTEEGDKIECFIHSFNQYSRDNPGQIYEAKLGLVGLKGYTWTQKKLSEGKVDQVKDFFNLLYPGTPWTNKAINEVMNKFSKYEYLRIEVDAFDKYYTNEVINKLLDMLGTGDQRLYYKKWGKWTENKCTIGITNMMRLHFLAENKAKATSKMNEFKESIIGYGEARAEGQKIGEQEMWNFMAHGKQDVYNKLAQENENKATEFFATSLGMGLRLDHSVDVSDLGKK